MAADRRGDARVTGPAAAEGTAAIPGEPIVVLHGGPSAEHDVSIVSGTAIADALAGVGAEVRQVLVDLDGRWWWLPSDHARAGRPAEAYDDPASLGADGPFPVGAAIDRLAAAVPPPLVFLALHGPWGEDGTVQALLDSASVAYTGSGVLASALGMDKALFKRLCRGLGIPVVDWREIRLDRWRREPDLVLAELEAFAAGTGDPRLMIKPSGLGSSVGMTLAHDADERPAALESAFRHDDVVLAERYLAGARDLEISVIGNDPARIRLYGPGEIRAGHEFYDYASKYTPGLSESTTTADVPAATKAAILKLGRDVYRAIGAQGFARIDFLLAGDELVVSEINTIPGFTPISLFPTLPTEAGLNFAAVCLRVVELARERHAARPRRDLGPEDLPR
jgi:D-alanine-D-alanine ligase